MVRWAVREHGDPPGVRKVLDLGCAEGRTLLELRRLLQAAECVGVEASPELMALSPPLPEGIRLEQGDVTRLPASLADGSFDLVTALAVLEHLSVPAAAVREATRMLRPGGLLVATCPDPRWDAVATRLGLLPGGQHEAELDRERLTRSVREAGLELLTYRRFMWAPVGMLPYLRIPVSPRLSIRLDAVVHRLPWLRFLFVNQCVVARRVVARRPAEPVALNGASG